jgi:hypothetical protein
MNRVAGADLLGWLRDSATEGTQSGATGFEIDGWEARTWVLHAMYEHEGQSPELSANEARQLGIESGHVEPLVINGMNLDEKAVLTGIELGRTESPGTGWHRLRWSDLAARVAAPLANSGVPPCFRWFPFRSWPIGIRPPGEGSLDREGFVRLADQLINCSGASSQLACYCYYSPMATKETDFDNPYLLQGQLSELSAVYEREDVHGSPSNIWPEDRSWLVYTDWDLFGTLVSGSAELIASIVADPELETVSYPPQG